MARALCNNCQKPEKACICAFFTHIDNEVDVVILRHAKESQHSKNTTPLLVNSLLKCRIIEGENFSVIKQKHLGNLAHRNRSSDRRIYT